MAAAGDAEQEKELLSSVVGDIRSYSGSDPLRPWLRYGTTTHPSIRRSLPSISLDRSIDPPPVACQGDAEDGAGAAAADAAGEAAQVPENTSHNW
jgi:hypothetical protein